MEGTIKDSRELTDFHKQGLQNPCGSTQAQRDAIKRHWAEADTEGSFIRSVLMDESLANLQAYAALSRTEDDHVLRVQNMLKTRSFETENSAGGVMVNDKIGTTKIVIPSLHGNKVTCCAVFDKNSARTEFNSDMMNFTGISLEGAELFISNRDCESSVSAGVAATLSGKYLVYSYLWFVAFVEQE